MIRVGEGWRCLALWLLVGPWLVILCVPTARAVTIGIVSDPGAGEVLRFPFMSESAPLDELAALVGDELRVSVPADKVVYGNWNRQRIAAGLDRLLADPQIDLILARGIIASDIVLARDGFSKPVVAPYVIDLQLEAEPKRTNGSGVRNLNYVSPVRSFERALLDFQDLTDAEHMAVLIQAEVLEAIPHLAQRARSVAQDLLIELDVIPVGVGWRDAVATIDRAVQGVLVGPLPRLSEAEFEEFADALIERGLPSFSLTGVSEVQQGIFAGSIPAQDGQRMARRIALNIERILRGEVAQELDVTFSPRERLTLNMATGRRIRLWPSWQVMAEAELLNMDPQTVDQTWSMASAVREALRVNLDLIAEGYAVTAGEAEVQQARAPLLPQLSAGAGSSRIDRDRADASAGAIPRRSSSAGLEFSQLLFSEQVRAGWDIARLQQVARVEDRETRRQDVATETAVAYLNLLSALSVERIELENLRTTRANLDRAQIREQVGYSGPGEVYRWQSELATDRQRLLDVQASRYQAEMALNRLLNRPLEERFEVEETDFSDENLVVADLRFFKYVRDPQTFAVFRNYVVAEGLETSPELAALDARIEAEERQHLAARRSFWAPELTLEGALQENLHQDVADPPIPAIGRDANDTDWTVALNARLPLYTGGRRRGEVAQARRSVRQLTTQRAALAERVEQNIRSALQDSAASFAGIRLAQDAERAAARNLELVTDAYVRGAVQLIDLLDAQNAALAARQRAANAVYAFLTDHVRVQRAAGLVDLFIDPATHGGWFERLETYFEEHRDDVVFP